MTKRSLLQRSMLGKQKGQKEAYKGEKGHLERDEDGADRMEDMLTVNAVH